MKRTPQKSVPATLGIGAIWAVFLIPFMPIVIPIVLIFYLGQMIQILTKKKGDDL